MIVQLQDPLWSPGAERVRNANLTQFMECVRARRGRELENFPTVHRWSVDEPANFWSELAHFANVIADWGDGPVVEQLDAMPGARWFPTARLNLAENLLQYRDEQPALVFVSERGERREYSYQHLATEVARIADGLRQLGVGQGDRVAAFMPNLPETLVAMLAANSLGAIWSSCSPDFGIQGVLDRFGQIEPKVLFTADGYYYAGKQLDSLQKVRTVAAQLPSLRRIVIVPWVHRDDLPLDDLPVATCRFDAFGSAGASLHFTRLPFDHPAYILYSSGTTGVPKCIVHGAGGTLLQHRKEHLLHTDLKRSDRMFYFTTCGWMMWNWLASGLASGATLILYEGSPFHPDAGVLWRMAAAERVTIFGTSAKYIAALEKAGYSPAQSVDLSALRTLLSTGSPLAPESFDYVYREIRGDLHLASISGGTDIVSCFCLGNPLQSVYRGEIQGPGLGMRLEVLDEAGRAVAAGVKGELACTLAFPSMPIGFWDDPDQRRYRAAYFERYPGRWHHGDFAEVTQHGGLIIHGRSDAVLNPGGVRIGTAEIYREVEKFEEILEAICIGQEWQQDVRIVLFVRLRADCELDAMLTDRIRAAIRANTTPRHVPAKIIAVAEIPRTISGKIVELAVRDVVHGRAVQNTDALANPDSLRYFRDLPQLAS